MTQKQSAFRWVIWFVAALFYSIEFFQRVAPTVLAQPISQAFQITPVLLGMIMSSYYYVYAISQMPVGLLLDHYDARWLLSGAALVVSLGTLLFAYSHFIWTLALGRILVGIGSAFGFIGCLKLARAWFSGKEFAVVVGLTNSLGVIGALFGQEPLTMLNAKFGWQNSMIITAVIGLIIAALIAILVRDTPEDLSSSPKSIRSISSLKELRQVLKSPQAWLISIYAGLMVAPVIAFAELWSVTYLQKAQHLSADLAAQANTLIFIGIGIGGPVNGWISGLINRRKPVMWYGNVITLALFILIITVPAVPLTVIEAIMLLFGFFVSSMLVSFPLTTSLHPRSMSGLVIAFTNMFIMIIGAIFQPLIGFILERAGHHIALLSQATVADFKKTLIILPIALAINLCIVFFIREKSVQSQ